MKTRIVQLGKSCGIRIPKELLELVGLRDAVEISVRDDSLVIQPVRVPPAGWEEAFWEMARRGDDALLNDTPSLSSWDEEEWEWR